MKSSNQLIIGLLNIKPFKNKLEILQEIIKAEIDIFQFSGQNLIIFFQLGDF